MHLVFVLTLAVNHNRNTTFGVVVMAKIKVLVEITQSVPEAFARFSAANASPQEAVQQSET